MPINYTEIKQFSTTHTTTKSISSYAGIKSNSITHTEIKSISTTITKTKSISMLHTKINNFRPAHKDKVNFDPHPKNMSISVLTLKPRQFLSPSQNQWISTPTLKSSQFRSPPQTRQFFMPLDTENKSISIETLNHVIFDPHTKTSQFWSLRSNQVNSDPVRWNHI